MSLELPVFLMPSMSWHLPKEYCPIRCHICLSEWFPWLLAICSCRPLDTVRLQFPSCRIYLGPGSSYALHLEEMSHAHVYQYCRRKSADSVASYTILEKSEVSFIYCHIWEHVVTVWSCLMLVKELLKLKAPHHACMGKHAPVWLLAEPDDQWHLLASRANLLAHSVPD